MKREHIVVMAAAVGLSFGSGVVARLRLHRSPAVSQLGHERLPRLHGRI
jgi:hypothetical protein